MPGRNWELLVKVAQCGGHAKSLHLALSMELATSYSSLTPQSPPAPPSKSTTTSFSSFIQPHHTRSHTWSWITSYCNSKCQQKSRKAHAVCSGPAQAHMIASTFPPSLPVSQHLPGANTPWQQQDPSLPTALRSQESSSLTSYNFTWPT